MQLNRKLFFPLKERFIANGVCDHELSLSLLNGRRLEQDIGEHEPSNFDIGLQIRKDTARQII